MSNERAVLGSQIDGWPSKEEMCHLLKSANLNLNIGKYSIRIADFDHFVFREYGGDLGGPCITADAEAVEELERQSKMVSEALSKAGIRHRFEVYDGKDELVAYFHHKWPHGS